MTSWLLSQCSRHSATETFLNIWQIVNIYANILKISF